MEPQAVLHFYYTLTTAAGAVLQIYYTATTRILHDNYTDTEACGTRDLKAQF
jgi:hypothetical protein